MKIKRYHIAQFAWMLLTISLLTGCTEEIITFFNSDEEIQPGESVMFTTYLPGKSTTRTAEDDFIAKMATYNKVADDYEFKVRMYEKPDAVDSIPLDSAVYLPIKSYTYDNQVVTDSTYATDGTLMAKAGQDSLYWPGNAKKYGFKATAGTDTLEADQSTKAKWLKQDRLLGYGFVPLWENDAQVDNEDKVNYHTSKEWYANNKKVSMALTADYWKKIPLYMKHQRSLITIRLKAGEGVERSTLAYEKALTNIHTKIYSYDPTTSAITTVAPLPKKDTINYRAGDFGTLQDGVETTSYTAVVEHHDYRTKPTTDTIAQIQLSGQRFTFYAGNDSKNTDETHMENYNLTPGKHLVITATLGRGSRKILITAYVEDWTETVTASVVDDYGQAGDPIQIKTRKELADFLDDETKNKAGNVAIIVPSKLNLQDTTWTARPLNCTLNLAGATIYTKTQFLGSIGASGNLVNGTIAVGGNTTVTTAVAETNLGTIERIDVVTKDASNNTSTATASRAGIVNTNSGTITSCTSVLPVIGTDNFVGGIAASSVYSDANGNTMPVIDRCTVNAKVTGESDTYGGGIVGQAVGRVTNNTYEYGITIQQDATKFKNIIQRKAGNDDSKDLRAYGNSWPTTAGNEIKKVTDASQVAAENLNGTAVANRYTAVIDSQENLDFLQKSTTYNTTGSKIRLSADFAVSGWKLGTKDDQTSQANKGNVFYELDGNDKTITTDGMLFTNIQNHVHDLTIKLSDNLIADTLADGSEAIAPLAYAVYGVGESSTGKISNIKVKGGNYRIQAATVGGIVVWAYKEAVIEDCQCKANIQIWTNLGSQAKTYAGGIVACAAKATITRCTFHNTSGTLYRNTATKENYKGTSVNGETTPHTGIFYGGILGATVPKGTSPKEDPSVLITDCTSWFSAATSQKQKGAIVGYAQYADGTNNENGMADGCQGNWWSSSSTPLGTWLNGKTTEQIIGKRNAVEPTYDSNY